MSQEDPKTKLDPKKSMFNSQPKRADFDAQAADKMAEITEAKRESAEISLLFANLIQDTKLSKPLTKGPLEESLEKDILKRVTDFSNRLNNNETFPEGYGSMFAISIMLKHFIHFRNKINELSYQNSLLEKKIEELSKSPEPTK